MNFEDKIRQRILTSHVLAPETGEELLHYLTRRYARFDEQGWKRQILAGTVTVNGRQLPPEAALKEHDCVAFLPGELPEPDANLSFQLLYEDDDILVVNKPGDLCVHPTGPFYRHTLWNLLGLKFGEVHFVQRLDRETSGLLVVARSSAVATKMVDNHRDIHKEYLALVHGKFPSPCRARGYLLQDNHSLIAKKRHFVSDANADEDSAIFVDTEFLPEQEVPPDMTLVRAKLHTGRQHQIRATLFSLGFPLVGDKLYGPDERIYLKISTQSFTPEDRALLRFPRQALHAALLRFHHPVTGKLLQWEAPFPWEELFPQYAPACHTVKK